MRRKAATPPVPEPPARKNISTGLKITKEVEAQLEVIMAHIAMPGVKTSKSDAIRFAIAKVATQLQPQTAAA